MGAAGGSARCCRALSDLQAGHVSRRAGQPARRWGPGAGATASGGAGSGRPGTVDEVGGLTLVLVETGEHPRRPPGRLSARTAVSVAFGAWLAGRRGECAAAAPRPPSRRAPATLPAACEPRLARTRMRAAAHLRPNNACAPTGCSRRGRTHAATGPQPAESPLAVGRSRRRSRRRRAFHRSRDRPARRHLRRPAQRARSTTRREAVSR